MLYAWASGQLLGFGEVELSSISNNFFRNTNTKKMFSRLNLLVSFAVMSLRALIGPKKGQLLGEGPRSEYWVMVMVMEEEYNNKKWGFSGAANNQITSVSALTIRGVLGSLMETLDVSDKRPTIPIAHGDPSAFPCFRTTQIAEDAIVDSLRSAKFNGYPPITGILPARRAVAEHLSLDLPYKLTPDDVFMTIGCTQAIEIVISVLAHHRSGANILIPKPGFPYYETFANNRNLEYRNFDLLPEKGWEVDLDAIEAVADKNTVAIVIINPGNPCGNVFSYQHLKKTARKLGILVISDEVYDHLTFGSKPFVLMGVFGLIVPVLTLGSISKRWIVPGWRLGWLVTNDPTGILKEAKVLDTIKGRVNISGDCATFIQAALSEIFDKTKEDFFNKMTSILGQSADILYDEIKGIDCISCPHKPEGSMFAMVKLNSSLLKDIKDDMEFCFKLAKEEKVIVLPGTVVGLKSWLHISFAIDPTYLRDGLARVKVFCQRHAKLQ